MRNRRTDKEWQEIFELRKDFSGTTSEFCRQHNLAKTTYYAKAKLLGGKKESEQLSRPQFIKIDQPIKPCLSQANLLLNICSNELTLPIELGTDNIVAIIKGLTS